ncbi:MAG: ergothioneine biosynthesis protein EgtB [Bacteroidales bacterium]
MNLPANYQKTRQASVDMCAPLQIEDYIPQPALFTSPPKWNLGHTSWFFEEMILKKFIKNYKEFHPKYGYIFNSYYNTLGERVVRQNRGELSRPTVKEVYQYRSYVDDWMIGLLKTPIDDKLYKLIILGLNHEQQHQELFFTDIKYAFSKIPLYPVYSDLTYCENSEAHKEEFIEQDEGIYEVGFEGEGFCFDNELSRHKVYLQPYSIRNRLVTNGEFLEFMSDGGYQRFEFWHDEALFWLSENNIQQPMYWKNINDVWYQFTLAGLRKINPDHILTHITYYEAFAFASWKGLRLPTEFEWEAAAGKFSWGLRWEWTESAYLPYPGYKKDAGAVGEYNGKFMVNQKVLRGGSVVSPEGHTRKTYRNFFHPNMSWQFNGIRLAK